MVDFTVTDRPAGAAAVELPAPGYPVSEVAVRDWFRGRYGRAATEQELGAIIGAMAEREATPPLEGPVAGTAGWVIGPSPSRPRR